MSKPVCHSVVVTMTAGVAPGEMPRIVTVFSLRVVAPIAVMAIVFVPVVPVPLVVVMPRTIVNSMVTAIVEAPFPAVDLVKLPPGELMIVAQRRAVIPGTETPVMPDPLRHMSVTIDTRVVMTRQLMAMVCPIVCRCRLRCAEAKAANDGKRAD